MTYYQEHQAEFLEGLKAFLRIPSISTLSEHKPDIRRAAEFARDELRKAGMTTAELIEGEGNPLVYGEWLGAPGKPTILVYGHYDVQPVDPLEAWQSPPFEPELRNNRVYARGAEDNKGQLFAFLQGLAALLDAGIALPSIRLVLEGQEESGSGGLLANLTGWRRRLQADVLMVADTGVDASGRPAITAGLRGIVHLTVTLRGASGDLHSGSHGGLAPNAAAGMARLLASLHDAQGRIAVSGFLDRVEPPTPQELELATAEPFDAAAYERAAGVAPVGGEAGVPAIERVGFRPTIEVNGVHAGYGGPGNKTVLPAVAIAKLSARLCPQQSPREAGAQIVAHLRAHCPRGLTLECSDVTAGGPALRLPLQTPVVRLAEDVLRRLDPRGPVFRWEGGSIPVIGALRDVSGASPLLVGFGADVDAAHAPNESFGLDQFQQCMIYTSLMLDAVAGNP